MSRRYCLHLAGLGAVALAAPALVYAHAFGQRYDLPLPLGLYLTGAGLAVALSFAVLALLTRDTPGLHTYPRLNLLRWRLGRVVAHPVLVGMCQCASMLLFVIILLAGFIGHASPLKNLVPTMVWVIWWIGMAYVCALVGDLWALLNPWRITFAWAERLYQRCFPGKQLSYHLRYPAWLGYWPAVGLFLLFAWSERVWDGSEIPRNLAFMILAYSLLTWAGMLVFGREVWLRGGEAFAVVFTVLARFAPLEVRVTDTVLCASCVACGGESLCVNCYECFSRADAARREWNLRPYAVGLLTHTPVHVSMLVFVLLLLATVSFDGFSETPVWTSAVDALLASQTLFPFLMAVHTLTGNVSAVISTFGLLVAPLLFLGVFLVFSWLMRYVTASRAIHTKGALARLFVLSLVPIAVAYHLAHYLSFLLLAGQLIIPLASDPFGFGWDLLGTAHYRLNVGIINARTVWFMAVSAIVIGHIVAVYLAHIMALRVFRDRRWALRSQYPMLLLMVGYTMVGLWILAQPIVK